MGLFSTRTGKFRQVNSASLLAKLNCRTKMKVTELRAELKAHGLDTKGKKAELEARLQAQEAAVLAHRAASTLVRKDSKQALKKLLAVAAPAPSLLKYHGVGPLDSRGAITLSKWSIIPRADAEPSGHGGCKAH